MRNELMEKFIELLERTRNYSEVSALMTKEGIEKPDQILRELGYDVVWKSLDEASIVPTQNDQSALGAM